MTRHRVREALYQKLMSGSDFLDFTGFIRRKNAQIKATVFEMVSARDDMPEAGHNACAEHVLGEY